jgi:hypothetical protein
LIKIEHRLYHHSGKRSTAQAPNKYKIRIFEMTMVSRRKTALLFGFIAALPNSVAFMPLDSRKVFSVHGRREAGQQMIADPHEVASSLSNVADHPLFESLMSTLYTAAVKLEPVAQGHSQPLFGPPDQYLLKGKSILPAPGAFEAAGLKAPNHELPRKMAEFFNYAKSKGVSAIDPRNVVRVDDFLPGFTKTGHVLPELQRYPVSEKGIKLELAQAIGFQKVLDVLPRVAVVAAFTDFFLISPGLDAYKEEIDDDSDGAIAGTISEFGVRTAALTIVAAITLAIFNN